MRSRRRPRAGDGPGELPPGPGAPGPSGGSPPVAATTASAAAQGGRGGCPGLTLLTCTAAAGTPTADSLKVLASWAATAEQAGDLPAHA